MADEGVGGRGQPVRLRRQKLDPQGSPLRSYGSVSTVISMPGMTYHVYGTGRWESQRAQKGYQRSLGRLADTRFLLLSVRSDLCPSFAPKR